MANIQVRRKSSGAITAVRFKRERPELLETDEFYEFIAPSLGKDSAALRFVGGALSITEDSSGWCTVRAR